MKKRNRNWLIAGAAAGALLPFAWYQNNGLGLTAVAAVSERLPKAFDRMRILQVSDLHNKEFGPGQSRLLGMTRAAEPDLIVITGDMIDNGRDMSHALAYAKGAAEIAPVYYVAGNHEYASGRYDELSVRLAACGVSVLDDRAVFLSRAGEEIALLGVQDPRFTSGGYRSDRIDIRYANALTRLRAEAGERYSILLAHRPEQMRMYARIGFDLVFAGHAHGGQIRLPRRGGLIAVGQGLFPQYTEGIYQKGGATMIVSRGLGNSLLPLRIFNRPELVLATLRRSGDPEET